MLFIREFNALPKGSGQSVGEPAASGVFAFPPLAFYRARGENQAVSEKTSNNRG